ncbi:MAG: S8 family serine peptidase, partial [Blastocatellia bacterium]|nr:S8 family serine peptidase [Blastocatellia bacterium]
MLFTISTASRGFRFVGMAALLIGAVLAAASFGRGRAGALGQHKLRVRDAAVAAELVARGGRLVADYGAFQVIETEAPTSRRDGIEICDEQNLLLLNAGALDTRKAARNAEEGIDAGGKGLRLVQFAGPVKPEWRRELEASGVEIVDYVPSNAYLVYGDAAQLTRMKAWAAGSPRVQWEGALRAEFKIAPSARAAGAEDALYGIQLYGDEASNPETIRLIQGFAGQRIRHQYRVSKFVNLVVSLPPVAIAQLAARRDVISIAGYAVPRRLDERQSLIVAGRLNGGAPAQQDYLAFLAAQGFTQAQFDASGFVVNVSDSGVDNATMSPSHFGLRVGGDGGSAGRVAYGRLVGTPSGENSTIQGCDGHGTINAHIIAGFVPAGSPFNAFPHADAAGFRYGLGVAPFVRVGSSVIFDGTGSIFGDYTYPNFIDLESEAYHDGARISSNSWGATNAGEYTFDSQAYDYLVRDAQPENGPFTAAGNQEMVIVFAAGNAGPSAQTVGAPSTAKNVITVGASENVLAFGGPDRCTTADSEADSADDMSIFSSRGPTIDGRHKPDLVAPGTHITGGVFQIANPPANGEAASCFNALGVCGGPPASRNFFPAGQQFYTASSGTSHSTPAIAGAAALVRQRFLNEGLVAPSAAMTKAALMNSTRYLTGTYANDSLWSDVQGMGAVNLEAAFGLFATPTLLRDQPAGDEFTSTGQTRTFTGTISDATRPFRVTLAWTDAPGSTTGGAYVNDLDLEVTIGGQTYRGNVFSGASSVPGGAFDAKNNVESVFLPAGVTGAFTVRVVAANIAGDGVPGNVSSLDQDFALVVFNMAEGIQPVVEAFGGALSAESCEPANNALDPGETVTVNLTLRNTGRAATGNLVATLVAGGGVINPGPAQNYGALSPQGGMAVRAFTFRAGGICGGTLTATLQLQDGATAMGTARFTFTLGTVVASSQSFASSGAIATADSGAAAPYPATIDVSGLAGIVTRVTVSITGLHHTNPDDLDLLLVAPSGQKTLLMSDCGGGADLSNINLTFEDNAAALPNTQPIASGTYSPTNFGIADSFPAPAPSGPYPDPQRLSVFNGIPPNGAWRLFLVDDLAANSGGISGGWRLTIETVAPSCCGSFPCSLTVGPAEAGNGTVGIAYSQTFTHAGGNGAVAFSLTGALPGGLSFSPAGILSGTPTTSGSFSFTVTAIDEFGCAESRSYSITISTNGLQFYPLATPIRLLDTRSGATGCDAPGAQIPGGTSRTQTVAGRTCSGLQIPANAAAITGNITTVQSGGGFLTLYPSDASRPTVANSNYSANEILNNVFTVGLGASDGAFKIYVTTNTDVVVDVTGYYAPPGAGGLYFHPLPRPVRLLETR